MLSTVYLYPVTDSDTYCVCLSRGAWPSAVAMPHCHSVSHSPTTVTVSHRDEFPQRQSRVERGSSVVECRTRNRVSPGLNPPLLPFGRLGIFLLSIDAPVDSAV